LILAIEQGENIDIIRNRLTIKRKENEKIKKEIAIEQLKFTNLTVSQKKIFLQQLKNGDMNDVTYRKMLITVFVNSIYLYDKELTIIFNIGSNPIKCSIELLEDIKKHDKSEKSLYLNNGGAPRVRIASANNNE
jgi:hypothetical protein